MSKPYKHRIRRQVQRSGLRESFLTLYVTIDSSIKVIGISYMYYTLYRRILFRKVSNPM